MTMLWHLTVMGSSESDGLVPDEDRDQCRIGEWVHGEPGEPSVFVAEIPRDCTDPGRFIRELARGNYLLASTTYLTSVVVYEYVVLDGVCHPVHRATAEGEMTPWRWNGEPCSEPEDAGVRAEIGHRLPNEEHGYEWGPPLEAR